MDDYTGNDDELKKLFADLRLHTPDRERTHLAIHARCTEMIATRIKELETSTNKSATENANLARKVYYLTWALAVATVVYAIAEVVSLCRR